MDVKKRFGADLEKKKKSFLAIGLLFSFAIVLAGFEYRTYDYAHRVLDQPASILDIETEILPVFIPKPPPPPIKKKVVTDIQLIDNAEEGDPIDIETLEIDESKEIDVLALIVLSEEIIDEDSIFIVVQKKPEFPGGEKELFRYLGNNIKYPEMAKDAGINGKVYVTFVIDKDGSISQAKILRSIGGGCDEEALRVVKGMPKWAPGKQRGKAVKVQFNLPVNFILK